MKKGIVVVLTLFIMFPAMMQINRDFTRWGSDEKVYNNVIDGYKFSIPAGFKVDEEFYPDAVRFISDATIIEIYTEQCNSKEDVESYINYTNQAILQNEIDYFDVIEIKKTGNTVLLWSRQKLSKIENDKNHYLKIDIPKNGKVYTILVKSNEPTLEYKAYLKRFNVTRVAEIERSVPKMKHAANRKFNPETQNFYNKYFVESESVEWGIYQYDYMETNALDIIENLMEHKFKLLLLYSEFSEEYDSLGVLGFLDRAYSQNRVVELTLQPKRNHQRGNDLFRVLDGYYDEFLHAYASDVASFNHPVLFRFANEMNGDWCEYSGYRMSLDTELYRKMYKYVYGIFQQHNADNVIWVWNPNGKSFPDFNWNSEYMYYPGDEYVDVLGLTLYNTGTFYEGEKWQEFDELYKPLYETAEKVYDMPFLITEFACAREGGNKEKWTSSMLEKIEDYPNIKFAVWWNGADFTPDYQISRAYYINDSQEMCNIFKNYFEQKRS